MSLANKKVVKVDHNFRSQRDMHNHLIVYRHPETEVSIVARICSTSSLDRLSLKVVWRKKEVGLFHVLCLVDTTQEFVVKARQVVTSVVKRVTS